MSAITTSTQGQARHTEFPRPCIKGRAGMSLNEAKKTDKAGTQVLLLGPQEKIDPDLSKSTSYTRS